MVESLQYRFEATTDPNPQFQIAETPKIIESESITQSEVVTTTKIKKDRRQGRFVINNDHEFQLLDKRGNPSSLFRISAQDRLDQLSKKELRELAQTAWDQAWEDYLEESRRERERGVVTVGNLTYVGSPPSTSFWKKKYY